MARLLVVEDYPPLATVIAIGLRRDGHEVERVGSVTRAESTTGAFELAVIDIELPDGSGVELAERLLAASRCRAVVFYTASRDRTHRAHAALFGPVVEKSGNLDPLRDVVQSELAALAERALAVGGGSEPLARATGRSGTRRLR